MPSEIPLDAVGAGETARVTEQGDYARQPPRATDAQLVDGDFHPFANLLTPITIDHEIAE
jgi:hypothetical protein